MSPILLLALLLLALVLVLLVLRRRRPALQDADRGVDGGVDGGVMPGVRAPDVPMPAGPPVESEVEGGAAGAPLCGPPPDYADLSRALAAAGRLREAALAQWAADLRVLAPLLAGRGELLHDGLASLAPVDVAGAVTAARAVAAGLLRPDSDVLASLDDLDHLARRPAARGGRTSYPTADVPADVLPDQVVRALQSVLVGAAVRSGDHDLVSVGLRCDAVAQVAAGRTAAEAAPLVIDVLEPHERSEFGAAYETELAS